MGDAPSSHGINRRLHFLDDRRRNAPAHGKLAHRRLQVLPDALAPKLRKIEHRISKQAQRFLVRDADVVLFQFTRLGAALLFNVSPAAELVDEKDDVRRKRAADGACEEFAPARGESQATVSPEVAAQELLLGFGRSIEHGPGHSLVLGKAASSEQFLEENFSRPAAEGNAERRIAFTDRSIHPQRFLCNRPCILGIGFLVTAEREVYAIAAVAFRNKVAEQPRESGSDSEERREVYLRFLVSKQAARVRVRNCRNAYPTLFAIEESVELVRVGALADKGKYVDVRQIRVVWHAARADEVIVCSEFARFFRYNRVLPGVERLQAVGGGDADGITGFSGHFQKILGNQLEA